MHLCNCSQCGMSWAIPVPVYNRLRECHNTFYCPSGHRNYYPQETEKEALEKIAAHRQLEIDRLERENAKLKKLTKAPAKKETK